MPSIYGNECKELLKNYFTAHQLSDLNFVLSAVKPVVRNVSIWKISSPWRVPERKIDDVLLWIVREGEFSAVVNGEKHTLRRNDGVIVPEYVSHAFEFSSGCTAGEVFVIHLHIRILPDKSLASVLSSNFFALDNIQAVYPALERAVAMRNLNRESAFACAKYPIGELLFELAQQGVVSSDKQQRSDSRMSRALEYIVNNFKSDISIQNIASSVNLHEVQFRKLFNENVGCSPHVYLNLVRLHHAAELLSGTLMSVNDIARDSGFRSTSYFCLVFRKFYNMSPENYRKNSFRL